MNRFKRKRSKRKRRQREDANEKDSEGKEADVEDTKGKGGKGKGSEGGKTLPKVEEGTEAKMGIYSSHTGGGRNLVPSKRRNE